MSEDKIIKVQLQPTIWPDWLKILFIISLGMSFLVMLTFLK